MLAATEDCRFSHSLTYRGKQATPEDRQARAATGLDFRLLSSEFSKDRSHSSKVRRKGRRDPGPV